MMIPMPSASFLRSVEMWNWRCLDRLLPEGDLLCLLEFEDDERVEVLLFFRAIL